jgi:hypothetical protein
MAVPMMTSGEQAADKYQGENRGHYLESFSHCCSPSKVGTIPIVGAQFVILLFREFVGIVKKCEAGTFRRRMQDKQRYGWIDNYELGSYQGFKFSSKSIVKTWHLHFSNNSVILCVSGKDAARQVCRG